MFLQLLSVEEACHKILVTSNSNGEGAVNEEKNITIVDYDHVQEAITRCLEEPVRDLLHKWDLVLNNEEKTEEALLIRTDIGNIRKQLLCEEYKTDSVPLSSNVGTQNIIPEDVKTFLLRYLLITIYNYLYHTIDTLKLLLQVLTEIINRPIFVHKIDNFLYHISLPELTAQGSFSDHLSSVVCLSVNNSRIRLLLQNHWPNLNCTWHGI